MLLGQTDDAYYRSIHKVDTLKSWLSVNRARYRLNWSDLCYFCQYVSYLFIFCLLFRVLCAKRPDPPRDNNTPVAANKRRRAVVSDGNMPPVPCKLQDSVSNTTSNTNTAVASRLQRCKSMVEHSATYELNKSKKLNGFSILLP